MVGLETVSARPALSVDDRGARSALAAPLPQALRSHGARVPGRARRRFDLGGGVLALAPRALTARPRRGDRRRSPTLLELPAAPARRPPRRAPRHDRARRRRRDRGGGITRALA